MTSTKSAEAAKSPPLEFVDNEPETPAWNTKTPHKFPVSRAYEDISKPEQDAWSILYEEQLKQDGNMCDIWKDEIQSLLTFAGLFSSVLAGFLATTYTGLQPNPTDTTTFVLAQIASRLDASIGLTNASDIQPLSLDPPFTPPNALVRMHVFWFLSLVTSLASAAIGISCLQWIREFQRGDATLLVKDLFGLQSMRRAAFIQWRVPDVIASLPLLLQLALTFFFIGMVDFLIPLGRAIATPTLIVIAIIFLFLLCTMLAPAFQTLILLYNGYHDAVPLPCAYKSPQSRYLLIGLRHTWPVILAIVKTPGSVILDIWSRLTGGRRQQYSERRRTIGEAAQYKWHESIQKPGMETLFLREWGTETEWLQQRHQYAVRGAIDSDLDKFNVPLHDAARGLAYVIDRTSVSYTYPQVIYHCFDDLPYTFANKKFFSRLHGIREIDDFNTQLEERRLLAGWSYPPVELERTEYTVLMLNTLQATHQPDLNHVLLRHQLELYIRVLSGIFVGPWMERDMRTPDLSAEQHFVPRHLRFNGKYMLSSVTGADQCIEQLALVFKGFLLNAMERGKKARLGKYHREADVRFLLKHAVGTFAALMTTFEETRTPPSPIAIRTLRHYTHIHDLIRTFIAEDPSPDRIEIVLSAACSYIRLALVRVIFRCIDDLLSPPEHYQEYVTSFGLMLQQCDAVLMRLHALGDKFSDAYDAMPRLQYLRQMGLERLAGPPRSLAPVMPPGGSGTLSASGTAPSSAGPTSRSSTSAVGPSASTTTVVTILPLPGPPAPAPAPTPFPAERPSLSFPPVGRVSPPTDPLDDSKWSRVSTYDMYALVPTSASHLDNDLPPLPPKSNSSRGSTRSSARARARRSGGSVASSHHMTIDVQPPSVEGHFDDDDDDEQEGKDAGKRSKS